MKAALISVVRDDTDILFNQLVYYYNIGLRDFYLMLHRPEPESFHAIEYFQDWFSDISFKFVVNQSKYHYHDKDAKVLSEMALSDGIDWIIGADADDLLVLKNTTLESVLEGHEVGTVLKFKWRDFRGVNSVYPPDNAFTDMKYGSIDFMDVTEPGWIKTCGRFNSSMSYIPGFHDILNGQHSVSISPAVAYFAHFPERNYKQFEKKIMIQRENWLERYGYFFMDEELAKNPNYLESIWGERIIRSDGQRQLCQPNKTDDKKIIYYEYDPINPELFNL